MQHPRAYIYALIEPASPQLGLGEPDGVEAALCHSGSGAARTAAATCCSARCHHLTPPAVRNNLKSNLRVPKCCEGGKHLFRRSQRLAIAARRCATCKEKNRQNSSVSALPAADAVGVVDGAFACFPWTGAVSSSLTGLTPPPAMGALLAPEEKPWALARFRGRGFEFVFTRVKRGGKRWEESLQRARAMHGLCVYVATQLGARDTMKGQTLSALCKLGNKD